MRLRIACLFYQLKGGEKVMMNWNNFKLVIINYKLEEIFVDGFYVDEDKLTGTPIWDIVQNVQAWLYCKRRVWSFKQQEFITIYPFRLIPSEIELDKGLYEAFKQLVRAELYKPK